MSTFPNKHDFLRKIAQSVDFSTEITDSEKKDAEEALLRLEEMVYQLNQAVEHLDVIYEPFNTHEHISAESVVQKRGVLNRFKQASKKKFEKFKYFCVLAMQKLHNFSNGDTEIKEIMSTLELAVIEVEDKLEEFYDVLSDYESRHFREAILSTISSIREKADDLVDLVYDRIIEHINTNLIGKSWMSDAEDRLNLEIEEKTPLLLQLFKQRQKMLGLTPDIAKEEQALNPSDAQRAFYPDAVRTVNFTEFGE